MTPAFAFVAGHGRAPVVDRLSHLGLAHFEMPGCDVFADPELVRSADRRGPCVVLGTIFERTTDARVDRLSIGQVHAIVGSGGRHLIDHFWGSYVAIGGASGSSPPFLVRDPSAHMPLYRWTLPGCDLYFNDFALACSVSGQAPRCDWEAIAHRLRFPLVRIAETGLVGISEIIPGSRVALETGQATQLWSPWQFVGSLDDHAEPAALAHVVDRCTRAWASCYAHIDLELSGGLDSSIVAASIVGAPGKVRCTTYATQATEGDERVYARAIAERFGMPLDEWVISAEDLNTFEVPAARVRPGGFGILGAVDRQLAELSRAGCADAIFSGGGGDNVFCKIRTAGPVVDALLQKNYRSAWRAARDLAELCETGIWDAATHSVRQWRRRRRRSWPASDALLSQAARIPFRGHPWLEHEARDMPGKYAHIANLTGVLPFLDGYDRAHSFPMIFPLLSQPVMELCLSIPSWRWIAGGRDRAFARDAFADRLPEMIVRRRSKGGLRSVLIPAFERDRAALGTLLRQGKLAQTGLLDGDAITDLLRKPVSASSADYMRIFEIADVELWVRSIDDLGRMH